MAYAIVTTVLRTSTERPSSPAAEAERGTSGVGSSLMQRLVVLLVYLF